jgi:hypothetical protein
VGYLCSYASASSVRREWSSFVRGQRLGEENKKEDEKMRKKERERKKKRKKERMKENRKRERMNYLFFEIVIHNLH